MFSSVLSMKAIVLWPINERNPAYQIGILIIQIKLVPTKPNESIIACFH